jgi:PKD repeat protein
MRKTKKSAPVIVLIGMLMLLFFCSNQTIKAQNQVTLALNPSTVSVSSLTDTFTLNFTINDVTNLWGWSATITWDSQYITMASAPKEGDFLTQSGHQTTFETVYNKTTGSLKGPVCDVGLDALGTSGSGTLAIFTFQVLKPVLNTVITIDATHLYSNQPTGGSVPEYTNPINPYPSVTTASATVSYMPSNGEPVADAGGNQTVNQFTNVVFNASLTLPQNDPTQNYTWAFFDYASRTLAGMIANYTFDLPGVFPVTLTVANSAGTSTATIGITVKDITPPVAVLMINGYPSGQGLPVNRMITFNGSESYDPYKVPIKFSWDFGDGTVKATGATPSHLYTDDGTFVVSLTVTNTAGLNKTATETVTVGSGVAATTNPNQTASPTGNSTPSPSNGASNSNSNSSSNSTSQSFVLPATVLWTIVFVTILVLGGSVFWLRKSVESPVTLPG